MVKFLPVRIYPSSEVVKGGIRSQLLTVQTLVIDSVCNSPPDAFKGFEQSQQHNMANGPVGLDGEEEPRRGASRANSVRFDESAIHGYYGQASRSSTDLPLRTGSGLGSHPLTERSFSHRSDGRLSSSGHSHHSGRTNSMGLETSNRLMRSSFSELSSMTPPPGLFLLGPVPCIIRCWLTTDFTNESLLYAAICSGSYVSSLSMTLVRKLGLHEVVMTDNDRSYIKIPLYLPEASILGTSSHASNSAPSLPSVTIRFLVREEVTDSDSIQVIIGSDVLRAHNADILFSQDKVVMSDSERNRVSVPLVRPERDSVFRLLCTLPDKTHPDYRLKSKHGGNPELAGDVMQTSNLPQHTTSAPASTRVSIIESEPPKQLPKKPLYTQDSNDVAPDTQGSFKSSTVNRSGESGNTVKNEQAGIWSSWRRNPNNQTSNPPNSRPMTVLRPVKASVRTAFSTSVPSSAAAEHPDSTAPQLVQSRAPEGSRDSSTSATNPIGGASAFNWLNVATAGSRNGFSPR